MSKFREVDDIASKLDDQIRKMVDAPWLFIGMTKPVKTRIWQRLTRKPPCEWHAGNQPGKYECLYAKDRKPKRCLWSPNWISEPPVPT